MPESTREELLAQIAALQRQVASLQPVSEGQSPRQANVIATERGVAIGRDFIGNVYQGAQPKNRSEAVGLYLRMLALSHRQLPLRGVHVGASDPTSGEKQIDLDQVYVSLDTTSEEVEEMLAPNAARPFRARRPLSSLRAVHENRKIVLLGDPGSGKSTFVNHLSLCLALHGSEPANHWCDRLAGWSKEETNILPLPVILRDFARTIPAKLPIASASTLWEYITDRLNKQRLGDVAGYLETALDAGQAIVLLDGLDEITTHAHRGFVRDAVLKFAERYPQSRLLVTCRTLSYQERAWRLHFKAANGLEVEFPAYTLAPFNVSKIDQFVTAWFGDLKRLGVVKPEDAAPLTRGLQTALRRPDLWNLAPNPLLLTVMALIHTHKGRLPDARALLYEDTVDLLLWRWDEIRRVSEAETVGLRQLLVATGRSEVDLKRMLWRLAYEAHGTGGPKEQMADIGELALQTALAEMHPDKSHDWARKVIETIKHRAGLLLERMPQVYTFPHRTFQEYLAGAHLASQARFAQESAKLVEAGAFWREVILLAVGKLVYLHGDTDRPLALVGELCPEHGAATPLGWQQAWLAGEVLGEMGLPRVRESSLGQDLLERARSRLATLLECGALAPVERAEAGDVLAKLGDPRPGVGLHLDGPLRGLPDVQFVPAETEPPLPAGKFTLDEMGQPVTIEKPYRIGRYPVTVAQFQAFVEAEDGYRQEGSWSWLEEAHDWWKSNGDAGPENYEPVFQTPNHPRVGVCWFEAAAFCRWLSKRLKLDIRLPREAEWEQAARWNKAKRAADSRTYPWGECDEKELARHCNWDQTGIGNTSAVGLFPGGVAECGAADMAGNISEWCKDWYGSVFMFSRVVRGGSWITKFPEVLKCESRAFFAPDSRIEYTGFRCVWAEDSSP